jgi:hypothetical protein
MLWNLNPLSWMIYFIDQVFPGFKDAIKSIYDWIMGWFSKAFDWIGKKVNGLLQWLGLIKKETAKTTEAIAGSTASAGESFGIFGADFGKGFGADNTQTTPSTKPMAVLDNMAKPKGNTNLGITAGIAGVQSEGPKAQNLYITINKMIEQMVFNTTNLNESTSKIKDEVAKVLLATVNDVNASVG